MTKKMQMRKNYQLRNKISNKTGKGRNSYGVEQNYSKTKMEPRLETMRPEQIIYNLIIQNTLPNRLTKEEKRVTYV
jgi:hypothetical protein